MRRIVFAICGMFLLSAACGAQQQNAMVPAQQGYTQPEPLSSPEMKALASTVVEKVRASKVTSIVVVGGCTSDFKLSDLGVSLHDGLNEELARQAGAVRVFSSGETREVLKRNRVSESMIYCNPLADWIAVRAHADGVVTIELQHVENGNAAVTVKFFDEHQKRVIDRKTKSVIPYAMSDAEIPLTKTQETTSTQDYFARLNALGETAGAGGVTMPYCAYCPRPEFSSEAKRYLDQRTLYFVVTVRPDGLADEIRVTGPVGFGTEGEAINALLMWRFRPSVDAHGHPTPAKVPIEIEHHSY